MLTELKEYLITHRGVCVTEVAAHFDIPPETARALLEHWVRKGKVARFDVAGQCQACRSPCNERLQIFQWLDRQRQTQDV
ncbi:FeoC-like transcriptional regulator [Methylococcus sp. Mc7]|uniref:FeoC-like transcriptional regulator n=1 Tax=Methylococcus sp. Mc7 TaxID=2860258 RepID=UPI001C52F95A|nr:FeoC-like transcriptional regulator [Methylococcus sp. Mc7]QXP84385.1 FeoC-like transcriptional regulator [Methylococcus sp. Mc7]